MTPHEAADVGVRERSQPSLSMNDDDLLEWLELLGDSACGHRRTIFRMAANRIRELKGEVDRARANLTPPAARGIRDERVAGYQHGAEGWDGDPHFPVLDGED